jgi:Fic family protein
MGEPISTEELHHSNDELGNEYACQKLVKDWGKHKEWPSSQVIPSLHRELMKGIGEYQLKGLVPLTPGQYRDTNVTFPEMPENYLVGGFDVSAVMQQYTTDLDVLLRDSNGEPERKLEKTVQNAAWGYYVFERIHPFLDGNGRIGRMIAKRVFKGNGYKDIIFQPGSANGKARDTHLHAMRSVGDSGNLAHLELYFLNSLRMRYSDGLTSPLIQEIDALIVSKKQVIDTQNEEHDLTTIWRGFEGAHLTGVRNDGRKEQNGSETEAKFDR